MRITTKDLEAVCNRINLMTKSPTESYVKGADGRNKAQPGNYHLSAAYGSYSLLRMSNEGGGCSDVFRSGHMPKRELYNRMQSFIKGLENANL